MAESLMEAYMSPWGRDEENWTDQKASMIEDNGRGKAVSPNFKKVGVKGWRSAAPDQVEKLDCSKEQEDSMCDPHESCEDMEPMNRSLSVTKPSEGSSKLSVTKPSKTMKGVSVGY